MATITLSVFSKRLVTPGCHVVKVIRVPLSIIVSPRGSNLVSYVVVLYIRKFNGTVMCQSIVVEAVMTDNWTGGRKVEAPQHTCGVPQGTLLFLYTINEELF